MSEENKNTEEPVDGACIMIECYSDGEMGFACD